MNELLRRLMGVLDAERRNDRLTAKHDEEHTLGKPSATYHRAAITSAISRQPSTRRATTSGRACTKDHAHDRGHEVVDTGEQDIRNRYTYITADNKDLIYWRVQPNSSSARVDPLYPGTDRTYNTATDARVGSTGRRMKRRRAKKDQRIGAVLVNAGFERRTKTPLRIWIVAMRRLMVPIRHEGARLHCLSRLQ